MFLVVVEALGIYEKRACDYLADTGAMAIMVKNSQETDERSGSQPFLFL